MTDSELLHLIRSGLRERFVIQTIGLVIEQLQKFGFRDNFDWKTLNDIFFSFSYFAAFMIRIRVCTNNQQVSFAGNTIGIMSATVCNTLHSIMKIHVLHFTCDNTG